MAEKLYQFKTDDGLTVLPTDDGEFIVSETNCIFSNTEIYYEFFSDAAGTIPVTPNKGTIRAQASPLRNVYLDASTGAVTNAKDVSATEGSYTPPSFYGRTFNVKITLDNISSSAPYMRALIVKHD